MRDMSSEYDAKVVYTHVQQSLIITVVTLVADELRLMFLSAVGQFEPNDISPSSKLLSFKADVSRAWT